MFTDAERQIFGPYDAGGGRELMADPQRAYRYLVRFLDGTPEKYLGGLNAQDEATRFEAHEKVVAAGAAAFDLAAFNPETGEGLLESQVIDLVRTFAEWRKALKKNGPTTPTSPTPSQTAAICPTL